MLIQHLAMAERHVIEGERHLAKQRRIVSDLERDGHDSAQSRNLLTTFEDMQATHVAERDRIKAELDRLDRSSDRFSGG